MTTPPPHPGQPGWRGEPGPPRPGPPGGRGQPSPPHPGPPGRPVPPPDPATRRIPRAAPTDPATEKLRAQYRAADVPATEKLRAPPPPPPPPVAAPEPKPAKRRRLRDPLSLLLIAIIVIALVAGGLAGAELYARHRADSILVEVTECVVQDGATISFGVNPPFLWQHITGHYTNISISTAGKRVQTAEGMKADVSLADVRLQDSADSKGTIGSLDATLTWTADGIKQTVIDNLAGIGNFVTGVTTDPSAGTLVLEAGSASVTTKPVVTDGDLTLQVLDVNGPLPKETVQTGLDELTDKLNENYPLGIHADSVEVTADGVVGKFSSQNASIPQEDENACFARL